MLVGKALKFIRTRKGISQTELANNIISSSFLSKLENEQTNVSFDLVLALIDKMGVSIEEFTELAKFLDREYTKTSLMSIVEELNLCVKNNGDIQPIQQKLLYHDCTLSRIAFSISNLISLPEKSLITQKEIESLMFEWEYIGHIEVLLISLYYPYSSELFKKNIFDRFCHLHLSTPKTKEFSKDHFTLLSVKNALL
ncbi:hypothetical protein K5E_17060 [Enterococcus thailandicus]|uniref:HTH cro/C1-type domain-containing protein n=1 Tax=bioreactor metagenome TaxID=1076179 RepID=A0A645BEZ7_9ZZZZ|nr:helix-turn-helix transcriptional regulator [Enterococcus thailandicus]ASZ08561.1 hypothetical protein CK496_11955 [Enterococcus thailandicus]MDK4352769.1 helix-turn-helix domain-containing protein [Enterococcus thailandicus]MDT2734584.1 helix-turn-helix transcriptional regulator [Enterococcus thailandicus]MEA4828429.1 helix-turn-helix transcriptional regulator [Enterococcus thailandicus]GMC03154.1 hypothetical protein K4E_06740 [Enterococcus thailandicus]